MPACCGMLRVVEASPGASAVLPPLGREPGRARVPAAPCPWAAAGLAIRQQTSKALLRAFLSWQVKMPVNPVRGGPGDLGSEVKAADIPQPAAAQHPWGIQKCISWAAEQLWSGCGPLGTPLAGAGMPAVPRPTQHTTPSSSRARSRACRQASPCATGVWLAGTGLPDPPCSMSKAQNVQRVFVFSL